MSKRVHPVRARGRVRLRRDRAGVHPDIHLQSRRVSRPRAACSPTASSRRARRHLRRRRHRRVRQRRARSRCGSSTGTSPSTRAGRGAQHAVAGAGYDVVPTSGLTWPTGRAWSTFGRRAAGNEIWCAGDPRTVRSPLVREGRGRLAAALTVGRSEDLAVARDLLAVTRRSPAVGPDRDTDSDLADLGT